MEVQSSIAEHENSQCENDDSQGQLTGVCFSPNISIGLALNGDGVMLKSSIIDHKFLLIRSPEVVEQVLDCFPVQHGWLGCLSDQDCDGVCDIWSSAKGSRENRSHGLLVHSSVKTLLIILDGMVLMAHIQWHRLLSAVAHHNAVKYSVDISYLINGN